VAGRIKTLLHFLYTRIYDGAKRQLLVFFDSNMNVKGDVHSYGHDIEAAWLLGRTLDICEEILPYDLISDIREMNKALVEHINEVAFCEAGSVFYERVGAAVNKRRVWWVQAEALLGLLDADRRYDNPVFLQRAERLWEYIKERVIDKRAGGEWYNELTPDHVPDLSKPVVDEWKCPYHNGRMCIEILRLH
jgi:mannobiose 2-epimerase